MALVKIIATHALTKIASDPQAIGRVTNSLGSPMPNIETPTMGGEIFWHTISNVDGWEITRKYSLWKLPNSRSSKLSPSMGQKKSNIESF